MNRVSELSDMSRNAYRGGLTTKGSPRLDFIDGIARALDANIHYLVTGFGPSEPYLTPGASESDPYPWRRRAAEIASDSGVSQRAIKAVCQEKPDSDLTVAQWLNRMQDEEIRHKKRARRRSEVDPIP